MTSDRKIDEATPLNREHMSFDENDRQPAVATKLNILQYSITLLIVLLIGLFIATSGDHATRSSITVMDEKDSVIIVEKFDPKQLEQSESAYRPCQIYNNGKNVRVFQTSLGEPSAQWSALQCFHTIDAEKNTDGWRWKDYIIRFPHMSNGEEAPPVLKEYAVPDADVRMDFASGPTHPDRPPIMGFGGAFTEASALNYMSLNKQGREAVIELLFGENGLGYSLGRVHINSCDFSVKSYSFDDHEDDFELDQFDSMVTHDQTSGMIEMMLTATAKVKESWPGDEGDGMKIIASPWSPPSWMKAPTKNDPKNATHAIKMTFSAEPNCLRDGTGQKSKYAKAWALYFSKFINAYSDLGLDLFGITVQNEPEFPAPWEACAYDPKREGEFVANHLGPIMREKHPDLKLLVFDHNKDHAPTWVKFLLNASHPASKFIDGTALHWYAGGMDRLLDGAVGTPNMHRLMSNMKHLGVKEDHIVFGSEACHCPSTGYAGGDLAVAWARAERYAHTILADLASGSNGWIEWNLLLDSIGGPNHLGNMCDAPLLAVPHRAKSANEVSDQMKFETAGHPFGKVIGDGRTREELNALGFPAKYVDLGIIVQPMYFYMGHISRHIRPGSRSIHAIVDSSIGRGPAARPFRAESSVIAGGGINNLARTGVELTMWPCEGSTRQQFKLNDDSQLVTFGHDWLGKPTKSCVGKAPDKAFQGLVLGKCETSAAVFQILPTMPGVSGGTVKLIISNSAFDEHESCLVVQPLQNGGGSNGPRGGAQVSVGKCGTSESIWSFDQETGEISSAHFSDIGGDVCMTTGWPFLQVGAFETPREDGNGKTAIVMNEAQESANFVLRDGSRVVLASSIPAHSIQTILFD